LKIRVRLLGDILSKAVYTKSQVGVIAITLVAINGVMLGHGFAFMHGYASPFWMWIMLFSILLPLYFRLVNVAFLIGMYGFASMLAWIAIYPSLLDVVRWYMLTWPVYHLWYYVGFFVYLACVYFSFKSYKQLSERDLARELGKRERMKATYTFNQAGAITVIFNIAITGIGFYGSSIIFGFNHFLYPILIIGTWILIPFIVKLIKPAFIAGIILSVIVMMYIATFPSLTGMDPWYIYSARLYNFSYVLFYIITILGIYFCYETYKELK